MSESAQPGSGAEAGADQQKHPLAHLYATVERSVNDMRAGDTSKRDLRLQARDRDRGQGQVWSSIRGNRPRGSR